MNTDRLISTLANDLADGPAPPQASVRRLLGAAALAIVAAVLLTALCLGVRTDLEAAIGGAPAVMKFLASLTLAVGAFWWVRGLARPDTPRMSWLAVMPGVALFTAPVWIDGFHDLAGDVAATATTGAGIACVALIVGISAIPLLVLLLAMRAGATARPARAGFGAGLLAGGLGACAYALHCTGDAAAFVSVWYPLAIGIIAACGALLGSRALAW